MSRMMPLDGALKNLKQEIPPGRRKDYLTREEALDLLVKWTGQNFGFDADKWADWLRVNKPDMKIQLTNR